MLTDYFSCSNKSALPLTFPTKRKIHQNLKFFKYSMELKFEGIPTFVFINFKKKKVIFYKFLHLQSGKS